MKAIFLFLLSVCVAVTSADGEVPQPNAYDGIPSRATSHWFPMSGSYTRSKLPGSQLSTTPIPPPLGVGWGMFISLTSGASRPPASYRNAARIEPGAFRWRYYLGRAVDNDPASAEVVFAQAIALDAAYAPAHIHYANALRNSGKFKIAQRHFERALKLAPQNPFSELRLGQLALSAKQFETARGHLERALTLNPKQSEVHAALAQVYLALGDTDAAKRHAQAAQMPTKYTDMPDPLYKEVEKAGVSKFWFTRRGRQYFMAKKFDRAVEELSVVVSEGEKNPLIWYLYGVSLLGIERDVEAVTALERALSASRDNDHQNGERPAEDLQQSRNRPWESG